MRGEVKAQMHPKANTKKEKQDNMEKTTFAKLVELLKKMKSLCALSKLFLMANIFTLQGKLHEANSFRLY